MNGGVSWSETNYATEAAAREAATLWTPDRLCHGGKACVNREVSILPVPNPNYRSACVGIINPGDIYIEYRGETAGFWESGSRYCLACGTSVWSR